MIGVLKSELFKLRTTRATKIVVICSVVLPAIIFSLTSMFAFSNGEVGDSLASMVGNFAPLTGLLLGVVGVLCSTQEYSQGTIRITLVATPSRSKVFVAKLLTTVVVSVASALLMLLLCLLPSQVILSTRNVTFELIGSDIRVLFSAVILSAFLSILGLSLGLIFKSSPGAISALLLWPTIRSGPADFAETSKLNLFLLERWNPLALSTIGFLDKTGECGGGHERGDRTMQIGNCTQSSTANGSMDEHRCWRP